MHLFNLIPGFRTNILWKEIIAISYYILSIYYFVHSWGMLLFLLSIPFLFFSFLDLIGVYIVGHSVRLSRNIFIFSCMMIFISAIGVFHSFFNIRIFKKRIKDENINLKSKKNLKVHFLSVGQADSILIQQSDKNILIDGGYRISGKPIIRYLKNMGVEELDFLIITHPHHDHIGGLPRIMKNVPIENVIINKDNPYEEKMYYKRHNQLLKIAEEKGINLIHPIAGKFYSIGDGYLHILAPNSNRYARINDYSVAVKYVYENTSFLFMGDAECYSEMEMLKNNRDVKSDVLKVGHHGSCTSSSKKFLKAVSSKYVVISVGRNSFYGQPDKCVLDRLREMGAYLYRTDKLGTIIAVSDGETVEFNKDICSYPKMKIPYISVRLKYRALHGSKSSK